MDCLYVLSQISMLGALLSSHPGRTIAVFEENENSVLAKEGDFLKPGLLILKIQDRRRVVFKCGGESIDYLFWAKNSLQTNLEEQFPEPSRDFPGWSPPEKFEYEDDTAYD